MYRISEISYNCIFYCIYIDEAVNKMIQLAIKAEDYCEKVVNITLKN